MHNHRASSVRRVRNGTAAELCLAHNIKLSKKKMPKMMLQRKSVRIGRRLPGVNTYPGQRNAVRSTLLFHFSPPNT
jgi:hypothetical protein